MAEHFKLFPGHGSRSPARGCHATLGEREIQEVGNCANSKDVLRFYRQDLTPPYNPEDGRWLLRDPMGEAAGSNLYCSCRNSMIFVIDRIGFNVVIVSGGINPNIRKDNSHDRNWKNFVDAAYIYISRYSRPTLQCPVEWWVYKPAYIRRKETDLSGLKVFLTV